MVKPRDPMRIIAHRGASGYAPENTIAAYRRAVEMGAVEVETDVGFTKDRRLLLFHDDMLERTTNGNGRPEDFTLEELKRLDAGSWWDPRKPRPAWEPELTWDRDYQGEKLITLEELLDEFGDTLTYHVEIKRPAPGLVPEVLKAIQERGLLDRVFISAIDDDQSLLEALRVQPSIRVAPTPVAALKRKGPEAIVECARYGSAMVVLASFNHTRELVRLAHDLGMEARSSGIRTREQMVEAVEIGCNGMTINWPDWLMDYWKGVRTQQVVDRHGYSGYSVVMFMPKGVIEEAAKVRGQLDIPVPMIPAHVTVKGTFVLAPGLEDIRRIGRTAAERTRPFVMRLGETFVWGREGSRTLVVSVESSPDLDAVHRKLFDAIEPITTNVYGDEPRNRFHYHMTVYQEVSEVGHQKGRALAANLRLPREVEARSMCLMGRRGPRGKDGRWEVIERFPFTA